MTQSRNAVSNLVARYKAVLKNCHLLNVMAAAALAGAVVLGSAGMAVADEVAADNVDKVEAGTTEPTQPTIATADHNENGSYYFYTSGQIDKDYTVDATKKEAIYGHIDENGELTIAGGKTINMTGQFTLHDSTTIATTEGTEGIGTLVMNGYLTQSVEGPDSDISGVNVIINKSANAHDQGELVLGNELTVGNVNFAKGTGLWINDAETILDIADGKTVSFADGAYIDGTDIDATDIDATDIDGNKNIEAAAVLLMGEGDIVSEGTLTVKANPVLMTTMKAENIDIAEGGDLTIGQGYDGYEVANGEPEPAPVSGNLTATSIDIAEGGTLDVDYGTAEVETIDNKGELSVDGYEDEFGKLNATTINNGVAKVAADEAKKIEAADAVEGIIGVHSGMLVVDTLNNVAGTVEVSGWDSQLVVDSLVNTGTVNVIDDGKIVFKNGAVASADDKGTYNLDGGEAIFLGKGLDLSAIKILTDKDGNTGLDFADLATPANINSTEAENYSSKITATKITLQDGVNNICYNGGTVLFLGDGAEGKFINNSGKLAIGYDKDLVGKIEGVTNAWTTLELGTEVDEDNEEFLADYKQGGTFAGDIAIAEKADLSVENGNWKVGNVTSKGDVYVGGYETEASLTTGNFETSGNVWVEEQGSLTAKSINITDGTMDVAGDLVITGTQKFVAAVEANADKGIKAAEQINASLTIADNKVLTINDGGSLQISDKVLEVAVQDGETLADIDVTTDLAGKVKLAEDSTLIIDGSNYTPTNLTEIAKDLAKDGKIGLVSSTGKIAFDEAQLTNGNVNASAANGLDLTLQSDKASKIAAEDGKIAPIDGKTTFTSTAAGLVSNEDDGKLTIGNGVNGGTTEITLKSASGNTIVAANGDKVALNLNGQTLSDDAPSTTLNLEGLADLASLTANKGASINVGSTSTAGILKASNVSLSGATIFLDPAWKDGVAIEGASKAGLEFAADKNVDGLITVGQNSLVVLGSTDTNAAEAIFNSFEDQTWGANSITAATFIMKDQTIADDGGLLVDGSLTAAKSATAKTATFEAGSALVVDASGISATGAALKADTIKANSGAVLLISATGIETETVDGEEQATVKVTASGVDITGSAWGSADAEQTSADAIDLDTIADNSVMMEITGISNTADGYVVTLTKQDATEAFTDMDSDLAEHLNGYSNAGNSFLDKAFALNDSAEASKSIESAAKAGHAAGIGAGLQNVQVASGANVEARQTSVAFNDKDTSNMLAMNGDGAVVPMADKQEGFGIWFMPMYKTSSADGFNSGSYDYGFDTDLYGATLGADYTFASSLRLGLAFNVGTGESDSTGDFSGTENDFDYVGLTAYAGMSFGNLGLYADLGYTASSNDITQDNAAGRLSADSDADLISAGIKADYKIAMNNINLTPYAGIRLNYYSIDGYNTKYYGESVIDTDSSDYTIIEFPVGLTIDTTLNAGDWAITPSAGLGVKFAAGDLDHDQRVSFNGLAGGATVSSEVADAVTFQGALGLGFAKDAYSIDLGYTLDLSENVESHGINVNLRYEF